MANTSIWETRNTNLRLIDGIAITRSDFESTFRKTTEKVTFTFNGWDGKSYNGQSRTATVYRSEMPGWDSIRFVKVGKSVHSIDEDWKVIETATGESHCTTGWLVDVLPATRA